jgi:hypothetical protein
VKLNFRECANRKFIVEPILEFLIRDFENANNSSETLEYSYDACSVKLCTGEATADDSALVELIPMRNEIGRGIPGKLMTGLTRIL